MKIGNNRTIETTAETRFWWRGTWDPGAKLLRLFCFTWATGDDALVPGWFSSKLSVGLQPRLFQWKRELWGWILVLGGVRIHRKRAYGGWM